MVREHKGPGDPRGSRGSGAPVEVSGGTPEAALPQGLRTK